MMKPKGPLDASTYTKWLRQKANVGMFNNDVNSSIPQNERKNIVSRAPAADLPASGLFGQLKKVVFIQPPPPVEPPPVEPPPVEPPPVEPPPVEPPPVEPPPVEPTPFNLTLNAGGFSFGPPDFFTKSFSLTGRITEPTRNIWITLTNATGYSYIGVMTIDFRTTFATVPTAIVGSNPSVNFELYADTQYFIAPLEGLITGSTVIKISLDQSVSDIAGGFISFY